MNLRSPTASAQGTPWYNTGTCSLGEVPSAFLVACDSSGLCALLLGDSASEAVADLAQRHPGREFAGPADVVPEITAQVRALLEGRREALDWPLAPPGTAFQQRVWQALRAIPSGSTTTYSQLAQSLGLPATAVRAVAGACAANPLAVAIPCHRAVRGDGALAGYRWGLARKRALVRREAAAALARNGFTLTA